MANDEVDRRSAILNAAVECFGTLGYYGTSLQRIATMVNLTKPGVLHYVGSKEGLLHAVLDEMYDRETEDVTAGMVRDERPAYRRNVAQDGGGQRQTTRIGAHVLHVERRGT